MANILEIIVQAQDMASDVIEGVGETAAGTASFIEDNWKTISATTAAAGAAAEGFARSQGDTNAIISRMSLVTGESEDALRSSIDGMTNWTFSSKDAARGAEELVRRGVDTKEGFEEVLPVMDNFSDATGRDIVESIKVMDAALASLGIPLEEAGEHVDTFTFLSEKSTVPLEQFERQLGKVGPELQEMGLGLDESASFLLALEEQGLSGREAVREFALAVEQADGDQELLMESLGLTSEELAAQQEALDGAAGMTDDFAAANNNAMTPLERVQQTAGNLMTRFGGLAFVEAFPNVVLVDGFGSSEAGAQGSSRLSVEDVKAARGVAQFQPMDDTTVVLGADDRPLRPGSPETGRVARTGRLPIGYLNDPEKTERTFVTIDGTRWLITGDLARVGADGTIELLGRDSATINTGGEKVHGEEVEAVLKGHPSVYDVIVVGVPDERWGTAVCAVVQPAPGREAVLEDLAGHCRSQLAGFKLPRHLVVVDQIQRSPAGKADLRWASSTAKQAVGTSVND